ncbi:FHIPEP family type III secretion protein [Erythrobacter sp. SCSIO 43205]|uniref:flagellar biosynthesis protein FlhA n=1 Tax=Erythrobacter sp. SCSIO 43205 TaxID=2779361 RepID=UPI001CA982BE|nr:flagellar biosynthesis protein FlhA [Erythrobacter sp. SCSIO 43205]UAB79624.1 FHIPEP family type III secretion protein [Erythrobacter sp. SCSIO 43205]
MEPGSNVSWVERLRTVPAAAALPVGIFGLFVLLVLPIPPLLLDMFFVLNIAIAVAVLMVALNARAPLDFSSFPTVLLFATLLRLALNVASTRIVLVNGHEGGAAAGEIIESFGQFLVAGNFAVGLFVFIILLIINMIVITKGAGRVSEVSARFVLDALPGKQMAIDADIAAGLITADEARERRRDVTIEADFYGSMDGASKFVKGDAIAALLILGVNIIAGFALGMITHGLSAAEAGELYITLAVGDALVAQVPALLLSIAAAAIVTRVADKRDLSGQIGGQFSDPRGWLPVAGILAAIGTVPAMPQLIFLPAAAIAGGLWWALRKKAAVPEVVEEPEEKPDPDKIDITEVSDQTLVTIELGYGLVPLVDAAKDAPLLTRITGIRKQLSRELGFVLPQFRIRDSLEAGANDYAIMLGGLAIARGTVRPGKLLAIDTGDVRSQPPYTELGIQGQLTRDPSFDCPALWIDPSARDMAVAEGFLCVDASTVIATHANQELLTQSHQLLGPSEVSAMVEDLKARAPALIDAVHPDPLSLAALTRVLRALIADGIGLAHPQPVFTSLALALQSTEGFDALIDAVRADLGARLVARVALPSERLKVVTLEANLESAILGSMIDPSTGQPMIEPDLAGLIVERVNAAIEEARGPVALIVQPPARRALAGLLKQRAARALVLSITELPPTQPVEVVAVIGSEPAPPTGLPSPAAETDAHGDVPDMAMT